METKNREKILMIAAASCVGLWLLNLLVISPLIDGWNSRSEEITGLKKKISDGTMLIQREAFIRSRWDSMRTNALPATRSAAELQLSTAFERWVRASGVIEGSFHPELQDTDTNYSTIDCRADISGNIDGIDDFLKAMSQDPLGVKVASFTLTKRDDVGRQLTLGLNLSGLIWPESKP